MIFDLLMKRYVWRLQNFWQNRSAVEVGGVLAGKLKRVTASWDDFQSMFLKPLTPGRMVYSNDVPVRRAHFLSDNDDDPFYEEGLINRVQGTVRPGDDVVIIGGGNGISAVVAAWKTGSDGQLFVFEPAEQQVEKIHHISELNGIQDVLTVNHAHVGRLVSTFGNVSDSSHVPPKELPECDVLVMDCEGAELEILSNMEIKPDQIVVETHGMLDSSQNEVVDLLKDNGYEIDGQELAISSVPDRRTYCERNGIYVVAASMLTEHN